MLALNIELNNSVICYFVFKLSNHLKQIQHQRFAYVLVKTGCDKHNPCDLFHCVNVCISLTIVVIECCLSGQRVHEDAFTVIADNSLGGANVQHSIHLRTQQRRAFLFFGSFHFFRLATRKKRNEHNFIFQVFIYNCLVI